LSSRIAFSDLSPLLEKRVREEPICYNLPMKKRVMRVFLSLCFLTVGVSITGCRYAIPESKALSAGLGRGINLGNALEAPQEGDWGVVLQKEFFHWIAQAGFDTVRIPIRWSAHTLDDDPYTLSEAFFARVDWAIEQALSNGLKTVINIHHFLELTEDPSPVHIAMFERLWVQIAERYRAYPSTLYYELLSEPGQNITPLLWNQILAQIIPVIRSVDATHTLIIGEIDGTGEDTLSLLQIPPSATPVIATFHYYDPLFFTHQGAAWTEQIYGTTGVRWPGPPDTPLIPCEAAKNDPWASWWFEAYNTLPLSENPAGYAPIVERLETAAEWSRANGIPVWLGEFGSIRGADLTSRANWTAFVCDESERLNIDWAYWDFCAEFAAFDLPSEEWIELVLHALIPE